MLLPVHRNEVFSEVITCRRMRMWTEKLAWLHLRCAMNCIKLKCVICSFVTSKIYKATVFPASFFWQAAELILYTITNKMQRYIIFFIIVNAVHVSGGFSAHHQELKNFTRSLGYMPSLLAATASEGEFQLTHTSSSSKQA